MESRTGRTGPTPIVGRLAVCPYDDSHTHPAERMQLHIAKCAKQHQHVKMARCKFNASHVMAPNKLAEHEKYCSERASIEIAVTAGAGVTSEALARNDPRLQKLECSDEGWETGVPNVLEAIKNNRDPTQYRVSNHVGLSKAKRKEVRELNAQKILIARLERGEKVDPEAIKCYEHRLAVPKELLHLLEKNEEKKDEKKEEKPVADQKELPSYIDEVMKAVEAASRVQKAAIASSSAGTMENGSSNQPVRPRGRGRGVSLHYKQQQTDFLGKNY